MSSQKCPNCGLVNWVEASNCKRCGVVIGNPEPQYGQYITTPTYQPHYARQAGADQKIGLAVASMVLAIVGFVTGPFLIGLLFAPVGLALGIVALVKAKRDPFRFGGKGFAIAGVVVSSIMLFLFTPIIAAIAIPNLLAARRAANEASAISSVRTLAAAETRYAVQQRRAECADLKALHQAEYIDGVLASGEKSGYRYTVSNLANGGCEIHAIPATKSSGTRSFYLSSIDGIIRGANKQGMKAGPNDPALQ